MIDTGCQVTILATPVFERICASEPRVRSRLRPSGRSWILADSSPLMVWGELDMIVAFPGLKCNMMLVVASIGSEWLVLAWRRLWVLHLWGWWNLTLRLYQISLMFVRLIPVSQYIRCWTFMTFMTSSKRICVQPQIPGTGGSCPATSPHSGHVGRHRCLPPCKSSRLTWSVSTVRVNNNLIVRSAVGGPAFNSANRFVKIY